MGESTLTIMLAIGSFLGTIVIALATIFLWLVTKNLAKETKRLAESAARAHIVATIDSNPWAFHFADFCVDNTGNATAYDIHISVSPEIEIKKSGREPLKFPFDKISVLNPGQRLATSLSRMHPLIDKVYRITITWSHIPNSATRESNEYDFDLAPYKSMSRLGASSPLVQIAEQIKHIREDWRNVCSGFNKLGINVFTERDRIVDQLEREQFYDQMTANKAEKEPDAKT